MVNQVNHVEFDTLDGMNVEITINKAGGGGSMLSEATPKRALRFSAINIGETASENVLQTPATPLQHKKKMKRKIIASLISILTTQSKVVAFSLPCPPLRRG